MGSVIMLVSFRVQSQTFQNATKLGLFGLSLMWHTKDRVYQWFNREQSNESNDAHDKTTTWRIADRRPYPVVPNQQNLIFFVGPRQPGAEKGRTESNIGL